MPDDDTETLLENFATSGDYVPPAGPVDDLLPPPVIPQGWRPLSEVIIAELHDAEHW